MKNLKADFPIFKRFPNLVYLDSTATALKPKPVIDKLNQYYRHYSANIFRGVYDISEKATYEYEKSRKIIAKFIGGAPEEIIFTRNTTESLNLLAAGLGQQFKGPMAITTTIMEHHSNFLPWQRIAKKHHGHLSIIKVGRDGHLQEPLRFINSDTKILAITYTSNVLGTINDLPSIIKKAKEKYPKLIIIVDAAQAAPHLGLNVHRLGADFVAFSGHKMLGPTGIGVLWGKRGLLENLPPYQLGGEMVQSVSVAKTILKPSPHRFEAGTPHIAGAIGLQEAAKYLQNIGLDKIHHHEQKLAKIAIHELKKTFGNKIRILGPKENEKRAGIVAFNITNTHPHDLAQILNEQHICVRAGYHCAQPLHQYLNTGASLRASFYIYNNETDVLKLITGLKRAVKILT